MSILMSAILLASLPAPANEAADKDDPVICKSSKVTMVGTRMKAPPICMRKSDWKLEQQMTGRELQQMNERGSNPGRADGR